MRYSGVIVARDKVDYGYVVAGAEAVFKFVVASVVERGAHVLAAMTSPVGVEQMEQFADTHHAYARLMSNRRCHARYCAETLDYVRSLPQGCRSDQLFSRDPQMRALSEKSVTDALLSAMGEEDSFRASVVFEARTPFLRADRRVVNLMDSVTSDAARLYLDGEADFLARVAEAMQQRVVSKSPFLAEQVAKARACVAEKPLPGPR